MKIPSFFRRRKRDDDDLDDDDLDFDEDDAEGGERASSAEPEPESSGTTVIDEDDVEADDRGDAMDDDARAAEGDGLDGIAGGGAIGDDLDDDARGGDDLDDEDVDWDDEDEDEEHAGIPRGKLIAIAGGGTAVLVLLVVLGAWLFLGGDSKPDAEQAATQTHATETDGRRVMVDLPPKVQAPVTPLTPATPQPGAAPGAANSGTAPAGTLSAAAPTGKPGTLNAFANADRNLGSGIVVAPVTAASFVGVPLSGSNQPLSPAPEADLVEDGVQGPLPKKASDDRLPWKVYARPVPPLPEGQKEDRRARVAIVVKNLGLSQAATEAAIQRLPGAVTLAFDSEAAQLSDWAAMARKNGHEILVQVPMESAHFPEFDPGPEALNTLLAPNDNLNKLEFHLSRMTGYVGILTRMGSAFTINEVQMRPVIDNLKKRGLMYVDSRTTLNTVGPKMAHDMDVPFAIVDVVLDETLTRNAVDRKLVELVAMAKRQDGAVGVTDPSPLTMERIGAWINNIPKQDATFVLVSVSAVANLQPVP